MSDIIHIFYSYLTDLIKIWLILWGFFNFKPNKRKSIYLITGFFQIFLLILAGLFRKYSTETVTLVTMCMLFMAICFWFEGRYIKKLTNALLAYALILFIDTCIIGIGTTLNMYPGNEGISRYFYMMFINIPLIILVFIKKRRKNNIQIKISKSIYALLFLGIGTGMLFISALLVSLNSNISDAGRRALIVITIIIVVTYCLVCFMMIIIIESRDNYKALSLISQNVIESQQKYYTLVNEKQKEIHSIRHEMKNHLTCIYSLYQSGKQWELQQYIHELIESSNNQEDLFDCGNDIVNAILNDIQSRYKNENIIIRLIGGFPEKLYVAPMDLCVIFANIINNAVEAIQRIESKDDKQHYIDVKITSYKDDLFINVKNPIMSDVNVINGVLITSKKDKSLHGFGVKNVINRVKNYMGSYNFIIENNEFIVDIHMKNRGLN